MRAWLFTLAVLATYKPIIKVASTEDISSDINNFNNNNNDNNNNNNNNHNNNNNNNNNNIEDNNRQNYNKPDKQSLVEIEKGLLTVFGFGKRPKVDRSKVVIPEAMKQLYAETMSHELDSVYIPKEGLFTKSANTVRSFTHEASNIDDNFLHHHKFRLYFNISSIPREEQLKAAELILNRVAIDCNCANRTIHQIMVYDIIKRGKRGKSKPTLLLIDTKKIRINGTESVSLDVQPAVKRWLQSSKNNHGLLIQIIYGKKKKTVPAFHNHIRLRRSSSETYDEWTQKQPILLTYTDDGRHKTRSIREASRAKRAHHRRAHRRKDGREICQRRPLYVDFSDVGWSDWIVAPPGYDAYYCLGDCPFPLADHLNSTNHAVVQTLVNSISPSRVPKACCIPTQLTAISMLYLNDQNTVVLKNYQDMAVVGCGCR